jgi:hypothetical protein
MLKLTTVVSNEQFVHINGTTNLMFVVNGGPSRCLLSFTEHSTMTHFIFKINPPKINKI